MVRLPAQGEHNRIGILRLENFAGELARRRNQIFSSLLNTYVKIKKLGLKYINKKVYFVKEEDNTNA